MSENKLLDYIQDAYTMENTAAAQLELYRDMASAVPELKDHYQSHIDETHRHRDRMGECLRAHGAEPSSVKGALGAVASGAGSVLAHVQPDSIAMNARNAYVAEHLEIASYAMLMATARAYGDEKTIDAARQNLNEDAAMAAWLGQHMAEIGLLALEEDGVDVPESAWNAARDTRALMPAQRTADEGAAQGRHDAGLTDRATEPSLSTGVRNVMGVDW